MDFKTPLYMLTMEKRLIPPTIWKLSVFAATHKAVVTFGRRTALSDELKYPFIDSDHHVSDVFTLIKI